MLTSFLAELRRRKVLRSAVGYAVFAFAAVEATDIVTPVFGLPEQALVTAIGVALAGFPVVMVLAWYLNLTAEGLVVDTSKRPRSGPTKPAQILSWLLIFALATAVAYLGYRLYSETSQREHSVAETGAQLKYGKSIAVLPFTHNSAGDQNDSSYFSDGVAQEILTALAGVDGLQVAARTSSFAFRGEEHDVLSIGEALRVSVVLEGSVRRAGDRLRVSANLVDTANGFQLWSDVFDYGKADVFRVQEEIARSIVTALELQLGGETDEPMVQPGTENTAAYELYLKGRHLLEAGRLDQCQEAIETFEEAISLDPNYAQAHAGLADAWISIREIGNLTQFEATQLSHDAITQALRINNQLPEAHTSLGLCILGGGNKNDAMQQFDRAIALDSEHVDAHLWRANVLRDGGELAAATLTYSQALALDPLNPSILENQALLFAYQGRFERARILLEEVIADYPGRLSAVLVMSRVAMIAGDYDRALVAADRAHDMAPLDPVAYTARADALIRLGQIDRARKTLDEALELAPQNERVILASQSFHLLAGEYDALDELAGKRAQLVLDNAGFAGTDMHYSRLVWAGIARLLLDDTERALDLLERAMPDEDSLEPTAASVHGLALLTRARALSGDSDGAGATLERATVVADRARAEGAAPGALNYSLAAAAAAIENYAQSIDYLERALKEGWRDVAFLAHDPSMAGVRGRPEYRAAVDAMSL